MLGSHRRISGSHRSRVGQILRSRLVYIRGAGHVVRDSHSRWYNYRGQVNGSVGLLRKLLKPITFGKL